MTASPAPLDRSQWRSARRLVRNDETTGAKSIDRVIDAVTSCAIDAHRAGWFPVPHFFDRYSIDQWSRGVCWLRAYPSYRCLEGAAFQWEEEMRSALGPRYEKLFSGRGPGGLENPAMAARYLPNRYEFEFGEHAQEARTPYRLATILARFAASVELHHDLLNVLRDLRIYDPDFDADAKITVLGQHASTHLAAVLRDCHGLRLASGFRSPNVWDILRGDVTIAQLIRQRDEGERADLVACQMANLEVRTWLGRALDFFETVATRHVGTLNRMLHKEFAGKLTISRFLPNGSSWSLRIKDLREVTSHTYGAPTTDVSLLISYLDLLYEEMSHTGGNAADAFWDASARAGARFLNLSFTLAQ